MDRNALLLALFCVVAVSLAATALTSPDSAGAGGGDGSSAVDGDAAPQPDSPDDGSDAGLRASDAPVVSVPPQCHPFLLSRWFVAAAVAAVGGAVWAVRRYAGTLRAAVFVGLPVLGVGAPLYVVFTDCGQSAAVTRSDASLLPAMSAAADVDAGGVVGSTGFQAVLSPVAIVLLVATVAGVVAVASYRADGADVEETGAAPDDGQSTEEAPLEAVGAAAGAAADRIEAAADVDNEVYRAWREMTTHVDVPNPDSSTPAEFAVAATAAGMDDEHVATLTELFRDVRYGGEAATEERKERAVAALRAIEARYSAEGADAESRKST